MKRGAHVDQRTGDDLDVEDCHEHGGAHRRKTDPASPCVGHRRDASAASSTRIRQTNMAALSSANTGATIGATNPNERHLLRIHAIPFAVEG
jgi:hypothetical protein